MKDVKRKTPPLDAVTRRAEEIRETVGCSWEWACLCAELERDERFALGADLSYQVAP